MRTSLAACLATCAMLASLPAASQQATDPDYRPSIAAAPQPAEVPLVAIDEAHANFHVLGGRFAPFGRLAVHGGYAVVSSTERFSAETLTMTVLVMANAEEAPSEAEIDAVLDWVEAGGSLLLIADHAPFGSEAAALAARLGIEMGDGYVLAGEGPDAVGNLDFRGRQLGEHPVISGSASGRRVRHVRSFLGQSLTVPEGAHVLLRLPRNAVELPSREAMAEYRSGRERGRAVGGRAQAVALTHGAGRVVVSGEAAMFTSQIASGQRLGVASADNEAYVLNVLDWLARRD